jgi:butyryl-CoA dehydrogenase
MAGGLIPLREIHFQLYEVLDSVSLLQRARFADHSQETFDAVIETARRIAVERLRPHNRKSDLEEPVLDSGRVRIIPEVEQSLRAIGEAGFLAAHHDYQSGGSQLPWVISQACQVQFHAANVATFAYAFLTAAAANLIEAHGTDEQKRLYRTPMIEGRFFGTMAMSEPNAGSSLGDICTRTEPVGDGSYRISGTKMWISGGEHEMGENIIHLVLARIKGAPPGVKGLSLFLVPRFRLDTEGRPGEANDVALAGINHKMGFRGTVNTLLAFGEGGDCRGWLVGRENQGISCMFHMMNEARIFVGLCAAALAYAGFDFSAEYARARPQGRLPEAKGFTTAPVPIIRHADVRRMLLAQKAYAEGALALGFYLAALVDDRKTAPDPVWRAEAGLLLDILTPVMKAWASEYGLVANHMAIQVLGGYGYSREYPVEQFYRDNRLNPIHEGTNGIQAIDLLGRKAGMNDGEALRTLLREIDVTAALAMASPPLAEFGMRLRAAANSVADVTAILLEEWEMRGPEAVLANATAYLEMFGHLVIGWMWLRQALVARTDDPYHRGKRHACRWFFAWELPKVHGLARALANLDTTLVDMEEAWI